MSGAALGQKQLLQPGDPKLNDQLQTILSSVGKKRPRGILKKPKAPEFKQLYLVYAQDCKTGSEHLLNGFENQDAAERACDQWQAQHRAWYNGFNNFTLFVRGLFLNKPGEGGLTSDKLYVLSADWE